MDSLPNELTQVIYNYSDIMSSLMLSMTCKRVKEVYDSNGYITSKDVSIKLHVKHNSGIDNSSITIKMCNTLSDIVDHVKSRESIERDKVLSIRIYKTTDFKEKCLVYTNGKYTISYFSYNNAGNLVRNDTSINGNIPIGNMDIWDSIKLITIYYKKK